MSIPSAKMYALRWPSKQRFHASLLSVAVLSLALFTLWLGHWLPSNMPDKIEVREVSLVLPPPAPPVPPPTQQQVVKTTLNITIQGTGAEIPQIDLTRKIDPIKPDMPDISPQQTEWQSLEIDWESFDLNQLDGLPKLLTPLRLTFPKSISRKGVSRVQVKLDVVIDERGQVTLVDIVENAYPELIGEIQRLVRDSRFSSPQKDNKAVRARFIWPIEIES